MRASGASFTEICKKLDVSKSTLSGWVNDIPKPDLPVYTNRQEWLSQIRVLAAKANKLKRETRLKTSKDKIDDEVNGWGTVQTPEVWKMLLGMLYWAEGSKGREIVCFANTDPKLIKLFTTLLRKSFELDESKFRVRVHIHHYHDEEKVKIFWSKLTDIPLSQFNKTYHKTRSKERKFRTNIGGICFIKYNSVYLQEKIMQYADAVAERLLAGQVPVV